LEETRDREHFGKAETAGCRRRGTPLRDWAYSPAEPGQSGFYLEAGFGFFGLICVILFRLGSESETVDDMLRVGFSQTNRNIEYDAY
jgi:hypothetical protein